MSKTKRLGKGLGNLIAQGAAKKKTAEPKSKTEKKEKAAEPEAEKPSESHTFMSVVDKSGNVTVASDLDYIEIEVERIESNKYQPRKEFKEEELKSLAESIRSEGLMQPITVRPNGERFELIAGERRVQAYRMLGLPTITARVKAVSDSSSAVMALIENLQRSDLNPLEEAMGYSQLMDEFKMTQEDVAERVGKARPSVANALRLLNLNKTCRGYLRSGLISVGHAKVLLGLNTSEEQTVLATRIVEEGLSVRDAEKFANKGKTSKRSSGSSKSLTEDELAQIKDIENRLSSQLKTRVQLQHTAKKGKLTIEYYGNDDLQRILEQIGVD